MNVQPVQDKPIGLAEFVVRLVCYESPHYVPSIGIEHVTLKAEARNLLRLLSSS